MLDQLINGLYYGILLPVMDGFKIFVWSNTFYYTFPVLFLLSIPVVIIRYYQITNKKLLNFQLIEVFVWLFRLLQYALIIFLGNNLLIKHLFSKQIWNIVFQRLTHVDAQELIRNIIGFCIIFGICNLILYLVINKNWSARLIQKMFDHTNVDLFYPAITLGIKNLFLIPVSVIYLFAILNII